MDCKKADCLLKEANALACYVSGHGDSLPGDCQGLLENLAKASSDFQAEKSAGKWQVLICAYAKLTAVTYKDRGVNGRTILDTQKEGFKWRRVFSSPRYRPMAIGVIFFAFALTFQVLTTRTVVDSNGGFKAGTPEFMQKEVIRTTVNTLSRFLIPALWGGIGACIFLAKRVSDKLSDMAFEEARMRGGVIRIFLGSMLGVVTVVLFLPDWGGQVDIDGLTLAPAMVAFVAGLGVKPVYAAFESLSEALASRFKGSDPNRQT